MLNCDHADVADFTAPPIQKPIAISLKNNSEMLSNLWSLQLYHALDR